MINGSSSGGGHLAIQIAEACGAEVTSVSSTNNLSLCKKLVADHTIDYRNEDFTKSDKKFDVVLTKSYKETRRLLNPKGIYIGTTPTLNMIKELLLYRRAKFVAVKPEKEVLLNLVTLMRQGKLPVYIDKVFSLSLITEAHAYMEKGRTRGKF